MPNILAGVQSIERSLSRLIADVKKSEQNLHREVDDLERETSPSHVIQATTTGTKGNSKSIVRLKSDKLEKTKALRLAQQVGGGRMLGKQGSMRRSSAGSYCSEAVR